MADKPFHVLIIGAGLAGLTIAHGLKKNGISYTIAERETAPRDRNWCVTLTWSVPLLHKLLPEDLHNFQPCQPDDTIDATVAENQYVLCRNGLTGETLLQFNGIRRFQIQKTKRHWAQGLNIKYGARLVNISAASDGVVAHFEDGSTEAADIVIGADGGSSQVRRWLLGDLAESEVLPYSFMNFSFSLPAEKALRLAEAANPNVDVGIHPKGMYFGILLLDKPDPSKPETWLYYILATWPINPNEDDEIPDNRLKRLRARMEDYADPYKMVVGWLPDDTAIKPAQLRIWQPKVWDNHGGRVTLAGDAAHSMTFHRGQGGNLAIKDAFEFVEKMVAIKKGEQSLEEAMKEYDAGVVDRGQEVELSKKQAMACHDFDAFLNSPLFKIGIKPMSS